MALIKVDNFMTAPTGSIGGQIFRRDRSGNIMYARVQPVKRRSDSQRCVRAAFRRSLTLLQFHARNGVTFESIRSIFPESRYDRNTVLGYWWYHYFNGVAPDTSFLPT